MHASRSPYAAHIAAGSIILLACAALPAHSVAATREPATAASNGAVHSMAEFSFLIGNWSCRNTEGGKPESHASVRFEWMYDGKVLKEYVVAPGYSGEFMTTLDKKTNTFKGVAVDSLGGYVVWENTGMRNNASSEVGYAFADGRLIAVSRTDFERVSDTHYVIRDFAPDTSAGKGVATDTEDCTKNPSAGAAR